MNEQNYHCGLTIYIHLTDTMAAGRLCLRNPLATEQECTDEKTDKHLLNDPATLVVDSLKGLVNLNPNIKLDEAQRGTYTLRSDYPRGERAR